MKTAFYVFVIWSINLFACGQSVLQKSQIDTLLQTLTAAPQTVWLPKGTIHYRYLEYRGEDGVAFESNEQYRFDGRRFYMETVCIESPDSERTWSAAQLRDLKSNTHRIFAYDGKARYHYFKSANIATVMMDSYGESSNNYGPFSAGVLPWGFGAFGFENLSRIPITAAQSGSVVRLAFKHPGGKMNLDLSVELDAEKGYAPLSFVMQDAYMTVRNTYQDYRQVGTRWIPFGITIEQIHIENGQPKLTLYRDWRFMSVDPTEPNQPWHVEFDEGTIVEVHTRHQTESLLYTADRAVNTAELLEERIAAFDDSDNRPNCAVTSIKYIARRFAKPVPPITSDNVQLTHSDLISLKEIKNALEQTGLYCAAVKTNLESVAHFQDYGVILHYPASKHYVILDRVEDQAAWTIDMTSRKFYWKQSISELLSSWKDGIALLVSDKPILVTGQVQFLDAASQQQILGGFQPLYTCTRLIQDAERVLCSQLPSGMCGGAYYRFWMRWGCEENALGEGCVGQDLPSYEYSHCLPDPLVDCILTDIWHTIKIRACL